MSEQNELDKAIVSAAAQVVAALGSSVASSANQSTGGANASVQGLNQQASLGASDTQHKTDVNVPEVVTSLNAQVLASNTSLLSVINSALGFAVLRAQGHMGIQSERELDHADQNHTVQMLAVTPPFSLAGDVAEVANDDSDRQ